MAATAKRAKSSRKGKSQPNAHERPGSPEDRAIEISEELLRKFGVENRHEIEAVETFTRNAHFYGNDALCHGLSNMFKGMVHAAHIYSEMKEEIHSLHKGILEMRSSASDARDQAIIAETIARQRVEVRASIAASAYSTFSAPWTLTNHR